MTLIYIGKGMQEVAEPCVYVFETELTKKELDHFLSQKAREYMKEEFGEEEPYDHHFHEFIVEIGGMEYGFCLGDHVGFPEFGYSIYTMAELLKNKIVFRHEDMI